MTAQQLFAALPGEWQYNRVITGQGSAHGLAHFQPINSRELRYREDGTLTLNSGYSGAVYREYRYQLDGDQVHICFPDGRIMHTLHVNATKATDVHLCGRDTYTGHYYLIDSSSFRISYHVQGPQKDFTITTMFQRISDKTQEFRQPKYRSLLVPMSR